MLRETHLLTDTQVGTAIPFSMSLPLNSLATDLQAAAWVRRCKWAQEVGGFQKKRAAAAARSLVDHGVPLVAQVHDFGSGLAGLDNSGQSICTHGTRPG